MRFDAPAVRTIVVGIGTEESAAIPYLEAGASGFLTQDDGLDVLRKVIANQCRNRPDLSPTVLTRLILRIQELRGIHVEGRTTLDVTLSRREVDVLRLIAQGARSRYDAVRIADRMGFVARNLRLDRAN